MKNILVPTDFTDKSNFAISSAATLARKSGGSLRILHVYEDVEDEVASSSKLEELKKSESLEGLNINYSLVKGNPVEVIAEETADVIVMGSREVKGIVGFFTRTNSERVAKSAHCPVITVKKHTDLSQIKSIVYATDMRPEQKDIIEDVTALQKFYGAHLHLIKVYDDTLILQRDVEKRLKEFAAFHGLSDFSVTGRSGIDEADEIIKFAKDLNADMIAMATHDRKGLERLVGGFISGEVIKESGIAIWTKVIH
jgi:nucleotide-binding universal stress UspA family protein